MTSNHVGIKRTLGRTTCVSSSAGRYLVHPHELSLASVGGMASSYAYAVDSSGSVLLYHGDGLGSIRAITDGSGSVVQTYRYDEYGVGTESQGGITQPFQYTGEQAGPWKGRIYTRERSCGPQPKHFLHSETPGNVGPFSEP